MSAVDIIDSEVRELVRREGLDPVADPAAVRRLVDEVISATTSARWWPRCRRWATA